MQIPMELCSNCESYLKLPRFSSLEFRKKKWIFSRIVVLIDLKWVFFVRFFKYRSQNINFFTNKKIINILKIDRSIKILLIVQIFNFFSNYAKLRDQIFNLSRSLYFCSNKKIRFLKKSDKKTNYQKYALKLRSTTTLIERNRKIYFI
jgi:hypothetical protein